MSFKTFDLAHDVASQVSPINEVVSIASAVFAPTWTGGTDANIQFFTNIATGSVGGLGTHYGYWQTVFDSSPSSVQATALFDVTFGYATSSAYYGNAVSISASVNEKLKVYREMASILLGNADSVFTIGGVAQPECFFVMIKRGLMKDELKKGTVVLNFTGSNVTPGTTASLILVSPSAALYQAIATGTTGNSISIAYVSSSSFAVGVTGTAINVYLNNGVTTLSGVVSGVNATPSASALVTASVSSSVSATIAAAVTATFLSGGTNIISTGMASSGVDAGAAQSFKQTVGGDYAPLLNSGTEVGQVWYNAGIIIVPDSSSGLPWNVTSSNAVQPNAWSGSSLAGTPTALTAALASSSIDQLVDGFRGHMTSLAFNNQTNLDSTIYFCRATNSEFNYSSNPTYVDSNQRIRVTSGSNILQSRVYITKIGLYDANDNLLAVGSLNKPITKAPDIEATFRIRLDY